MSLEQLEAAGVPGGPVAGRDVPVARRDDLDREAHARAVVFGEPPLRRRDQHPLARVGIRRAHLAHVARGRARGVVGRPERVDLVGRPDLLRTAAHRVVDRAVRSREIGDAGARLTAGAGPRRAGRLDQGIFG